MSAAGAPGAFHIFIPNSVIIGMRQCSYRNADGTLCLANAGTVDACGKHRCSNCGESPCSDADKPDNSLARLCLVCYLADAALD